MNVIRLEKYDILKPNLLKFSFSPSKAGYYEILGVVEKNDKKEISNQIVINIVEDDLEMSNIYLDKTHLVEVTENNNGLYYHINNSDRIISQLNTNKIYSNKDILRDILSYQFFLIILIFLLISEWYIRIKICLP